MRAARGPFWCRRIRLSTRSSWSHLGDVIGSATHGDTKEEAIFHRPHDAGKEGEVDLGAVHEDVGGERRARGAQGYLDNLMVPGEAAGGGGVPALAGIGMDVKEKAIELGAAVAVVVLLDMATGC